MDKALFDLLQEGLKLIDPSLCEPSKLSLMQKYYDQLMLFNPSLKLVGAEGRDLVVKHFLDSISPVPIMKSYMEGKTVRAADLGSGNGLPGVLLSCCLDQWHFDLVDRMGRRITFLMGTTARLGLASAIGLVESDLANLKRTYNAVVFRAFRPFRDIAVDLARIIEPGGYAFAYKSSEDNIREELLVLDSLVPGCFENETVDYEVPFLDAKRTLLVLKRV